ncbi:hypothetical protein Y032_0006g2959 [Ancylostoma ceylanicum]|uniref:Uncharacterized protein n=1 Tax=Ancylostoma ceylanicum TaxID=53326 RepID=A0A016VPQ4_9BILA|nr:hypothetical protein Y032_0006g2959 [Ancylostoma ceylanicum]
MGGWITLTASAAVNSELTTVDPTTVFRRRTMIQSLIELVILVAIWGQILVPCGGRKQAGKGDEPGADKEEGKNNVGAGAGGAPAAGGGAPAGGGGAPAAGGGAPAAGGAPADGGGA